MKPFAVSKVLVLRTNSIGMKRSLVPEDTAHVVAFLVPARLWAQEADFVRANYVKQESEIPMRDGKKLFTSVYLPKDASARRKFRIDRLYVRKLTFGLDVRLIALSFWISFRGKWETRGSKT